MCHFNLGTECTMSGEAVCLTGCALADSQKRLFVQTSRCGLAVECGSTESLPVPLCPIFKLDKLRQGRQMDLAQPPICLHAYSQRRGGGGAGTRPDPRLHVRFSVYKRKLLDRHGNNECRTCNLLPSRFCSRMSVATQGRKSWISKVWSDL